MPARTEADIDSPAPHRETRLTAATTPPLTPTANAMTRPANAGKIVHGAASAARAVTGTPLYEMDWPRFP